MNLLAPVGSRRSILLVAPSAERTDATLCLLAFLRWTRQSVARPPRTVLLSGGIMQPEFKAAGARVIDDPPSPLRTAERALRRRGQPKLAKAARLALHASVFRQPRRPRCIYASTVHGAGPALRNLGPGSRLVVHAFETGDVLDQMINEAMMARLRRGVSLWLAASEGVALGLEERGVDPERILLIAPFIDQPTANHERVAAARQSLGLGPDDIVVGGVGRSDWRDAPDIFLRLAAMTKRRWPELKVRFVWVGAPDDGPTRWILDHDIRQAGLDDYVTLTGDLSETETWLSTFDILALTSRVDPPPPAGLQAGALGVPMVAFDVRTHGSQAASPLLAESSNGSQLVPYLDVEAMASAVAHLLRDAEARRALGARFRDTVLQSHLTESRAQALWSALERTARGLPPDRTEIP
jgi:glycosyltransferase involved in cell wall biosynthesis